MEKKRVQDVAKELGLKPKKLIQFLEEWAPRDDEKRWSNFHILEDEQLEMIYQEFGKPKVKEATVAVEEEEVKKEAAPEEEEEIKVEEKPIEEVVAEVLGKELKEEKAKEELKPPRPERKPRVEKRRPVREFKRPPKAEEKPKEVPEPVEEKKEVKKPQAVEEEKKKEKLSKEEEQLLKKLQQQMEREKKKEEKRQKEKKEEEIKIVEIYEGITVRELADMLHVPANKVMEALLKKGILATINQAVPTEVAIEIAESFGFLAEAKKEEEEEVLIEEIPDRPEDLKPRPPIVVVMGHVDHGKTTLLDTIRKTNVAEKEKGGITQHIGASQVKLQDGRVITFLDTPGHEAFTSLRARGAQITDIAVLVVAADDGVMPQTVEAINHAKAFNVPIVVAVNKIDKPGADPMRVRRELSEHGLIPEEWGGDTVFVDVSAKTGQGVDQLLEMIGLVADILELKANPDKRAKGVIIETKLDRKKGPTATVIVQEGTLRVGDIFVAGITNGRVRAMFDDKGRQVKEAKPSTPVEVLGFEELPEAGDTLIVVDSEKKARDLALKLKTKREKEEKLAQGVRLEDIYKKIEAGEIKELRVIVKADTMGSLEALKKSLEDLSTEEVAVRIIHGAVGGITENDVMLAKASGAIIIGFNTRPDPKARELIEKEKVDVRMYGIIYQVIDDVKNALQGLLTPIEKEKVLGSAEVRATFKVKKVGTVAGCYVLDGKIVRGAKARLIRDGVVVYDGQIENLKRFKEDVQEVARGYECGIKLRDFNDIKVGDVIECYEIKLEQPTL
ncbi:translation initiation factor IF-2 [Hydrogenivirga caldilitoris]|uniref:Translation initiation factor IF-2 n=1 Tax=Hydrogenivirga caldilitoris TaxID=246264 RepID=A0A497XTD6_9AQUI|nr:translation initiation factor IF-2 [Hydrogenivirga caldilitoris]RLJ71430.1 translation initiation factor IF-2 [Hydrogenivirga caldilitoris]